MGESMETQPLLGNFYFRAKALQKCFFNGFFQRIRRVGNEK